MIPRTRLVALCIVLIVPAVLSAALYHRLPDPAPVHWGLHGEADGFGPRWVIAFVTPAASALLMGLLLVLPRLGPFSENLRRSMGAYGNIVVALAIMLGAMHVIFLLKAMGHPVRVEVVLPFVVGLLLAALGNWMGKLRRNFWVGLRTPWTLASDVVWERTHRLGGRLFVALGLTVSAVTWLGLPWLTFGTLAGGAVLLVLWSVGYSLWVYRHTAAIEGTL